MYISIHDWIGSDFNEAKLANYDRGPPSNQSILIKAEIRQLMKRMQSSEGISECYTHISAIIIYSHAHELSNEYQQTNDYYM